MFKNNVEKIERIGYAIVFSKGEDNELEGRFRYNWFHFNNYLLYFCFLGIRYNTKLAFLNYGK